MSVAKRCGSNHFRSEGSFSDALNPPTDAPRRRCPGLMRRSDRRLERRRQPQPHQLRHDRRKDYGLIVRRLSWSLTPHR
jgi:hypothetical protein